MTKGYVYKNNFGYLNGLENRVEHRKILHGSACQTMPSISSSGTGNSRSAPTFPSSLPHSEYVEIPGVIREIQGIRDCLMYWPSCMAPSSILTPTLGVFWSRLEELGSGRGYRRDLSIGQRPQSNQYAHWREILRIRLGHKKPVRTDEATKLTRGRMGSNRLATSVGPEGLIARKWMSLPVLQISFLR